MIRVLCCTAAAVVVLGGALHAADDKKPDSSADALKKQAPQVKKDALPKAPAKEASREDLEAKRKLKEQIRAEAGSQPGGQKGRLTKIGVEGGTVTLVVDDQTYEFAITDRTLAMLKTAEKDGKRVVLGFQLTNAAEGLKQGLEKKAVDKPDATAKQGQPKIPAKEAQKKPSEKPREEKPE